MKVINVQMLILQLIHKKAALCAAFLWINVITDVTWNPHPSSPSPAGEGEQNPYFLVPLSCGRGARGEGLTIFHVTPVIKKRKAYIARLAGSIGFSEVYYKFDLDDSPYYALSQSNLR
jgi:hypothetical protein